MTKVHIINMLRKALTSNDEAWEEGYKIAQKEAFDEITKNYQPNTKMSARNYIFLVATAFIFFFIALADLYLHAWNQTYHWFSYMSWYGKMSTVCFAIIVLVLFLSPLFKSKK